MRSRIVLACAIALCIACIVGTTVAYFTAEDTARNVITAGSLKISVIEQQDVNGELIDYPDEPIVVVPGDEPSKIVTVKNEDKDAYIRLKYEITVKDKEGNVMDVPEGLVTVKASNDAWVTVNEDGWFYYNAVVKTGEITAPAIENVVFSPEMGNEYQEATAEVIITAQAVQSDNNGESVTDAQGWPEEK